MNTAFEFMKRNGFFHDSGIESVSSIANKTFIKLDDFTLEILNGKISKTINGDLSEMVVIRIDTQVSKGSIIITVKMDHGFIEVSGSDIAIYDNSNNKLAAKGFA